MFNRFSFKTKLLSLCVFLVLVAVFVGGVGVYSLEKVSAKYDFIMDKTMPKQELVYKMFLSYRRVRITLRTLGIQGLDQASAQKAIEEALHAIAEYEESNKAYVALGFVPGQKELYDKMESTWVDFKATGAKVLELHKSGKAEDMQKITEIFLTECPLKAAIFTAAGNDVVKFHDEMASQKVAEAKSEATQADLISIFTILFGCGIGLTIGVLFSTKVAKTMNQIIEALAENANQVSSASSQIASASEELSQATTEQAASLEETAASVEEMSSMVNKNAENARNTASTSQGSEKKASDGKQVIDQMLSSMNEINQSNVSIMEQINCSNQQMGEIVRVIQEIGEKTKVINDIVFQTKLLSFNASVEAARAGEHGKGFAVVAEEVGNLAAMSGNAAKEISTMLEGSMHKVKTIVDETKQKVEVLVNTGKEKVETGSSVARQCAKMFEEIAQDVSSTSMMANEISTATQEQASGIQEITKAMGSLDQVTQQNAATAEEAASSAEELSAQAESLKSVVGQLTSTMRGSSQEAKAPAPKSEAETAKPEKGNVVRLKAKTAAKAAPALKAASGDDTIPERSHPAFSDV